MTEEQVGDRERDAREAVQERDLPQRPPTERLDVREEHEHDDEVDEGDRERREHVDDERDPVLEPRANLRTDELAVERERLADVSHPARPASWYRRPAAGGRRTGARSPTCPGAG